MPILLMLFTLALVAQPPEEGVPVQMVVTAEAQKGHEIPQLSAGDVIIHQDKNRPHANDWVALQGDRAGLQLAVLIDDGADSDLSLQYSDLKKFMRAQPASTQFGVYYMRNGSALAAQTFTADREMAAKSLRLPLGEPGAASSPFLALADLIKKWPATSDRREVLMITSGIDLYRGFPTENPYLETAIRASQRAGVLVHSIYYSGAGHFGHDYHLINFGRDNLSYLGDESGGEAYWQGLSTAVSFQPYLDDLTIRLNHQYLLTFRTQSAKKGEFQSVKLRSEVPHVELMAAEKVWAPGSK